MKAKYDPDNLAWAQIDVTRFHSAHRRDPATRPIATARAVLGEDEFARTWADGQSLTLEEAIAEATNAPRIVGSTN